VGLEEAAVAQKHEIEINIDDNGNVSFKVMGLKGKKCLAVTKELEEALGIVRSQEKTAEYYQTDTQASTQVEKKGG
jgi:hypothetical protein